LWIASIWWTFRDIRGRTNDLFLQLAATLLVTIFSFPGLLIYMILRPPKTLAELYEESLEEEAFLQGIEIQTACPVCKNRADTDFIFCPWCQTRLKRLCVRCDRPLMLRWKLCPYCGQSVTTSTPAAAPYQPAAAARQALVPSPPAQSTAVASTKEPRRAERGQSLADRPVRTVITREPRARDSGARDPSALDSKAAGNGSRQAGVVEPQDKQSV
jgi:hypothetical protein